MIPDRLICQIFFPDILPKGTYHKKFEKSKCMFVFVLFSLDKIQAENENFHKMPVGFNLVKSITIFQYCQHPFILFIYIYRLCYLYMFHYTSKKYLTTYHLIILRIYHLKCLYLDSCTIQYFEI